MIKKAITVLIVATLLISVFPNVSLAESGSVYDLVYDANGGTGAVPSTISSAENSTTEVSGGGDLVNGDQNFWKWNTKEDGTERDYFPGDEFVFTENTVLYAIYRIPVHVSSVTLSSGSETIAVGDILSLSATVFPEDADFPEVTWTSSEGSAATVDQNGQVTAVGAGNTTIRATAEEYYFDECTITVVPTYTVTFNTQGGKQIPSVSAPENGHVADPGTPEKTGYTFEGWFKEQECLNPWNFDNDTVTGDTAIWALWTQDGIVFSGSGTEANPYRIESAADMAQLAALVNAGDTLYNDKYYIQTQDIDLSAYENWTPIGIRNYVFSGAYDGSNNKIESLNINSPYVFYAGLFGYVDGTVRNVNIESGNISIESTGTVHAGSIVGYLHGGAVDNCTSAVDINIEDSAYVGYKIVGGIVGDAYQSVNIAKCINYGDISVEGIIARPGGIAGLLNCTINISECANFGSIEASGYTVQAGGIVGFSAVQASGNLKNTVSKCFNCGPVRGSTSGGIVGYSGSSDITNCFNTGNIMTGPHNGEIGGILGYGYSSYIVQNCYNLGIIYGNGITGGIAGTYTGTSTGNYYYAAACSTGIGSGSATACSKTLAEMKLQATYLGFDFDTIWTMNKAQETGYDFPQLQSNLLNADPLEVTFAAGSDKGTLQGAGNYSFLDTVTITETPNDHYTFTGWEVVSGGVTLSSTTDSAATFTMPPRDVAIAAIFSNTQYNVNVQNYGNGTASGSGNYAWGSTVSISATAGNGYQFMYWEVISGGTVIADIYDMTTTFEMPHSDVTIKAIFDVNPAGYQCSISNEKATITNYNSPATPSIVKIPYKLGGYLVTAIGTEAFKIHNEITNVIIPDSVVSIGDNAFKSCDKLNYVYFGKGVQTIGLAPFRSCKKINTLSISPDNPHLKVIDNVLYNKAGTEVVYFPPARTGAFSIPQGVLSVGDYAFADAAITSVNLPGSISNIGNYAFACAAITNVNLPGSITDIGDYAFADEPNLKSINISDAAAVIGDSAFYNCLNLRNVSIGNNITRIESYAFNNCDGITGIDIPDTVTYLGASAFRDCDGLTNIEIPGTIVNISDSAFFSCQNLKSVIFGEGVESIGVSAFQSCNLNNIEFPSTLKALQNYSFNDNSECRAVYFRGPKATLGTDVFTGYDFKVYYHISEETSWRNFAIYPKLAFCRLMEDLQDANGPVIINTALTDSKLPAIPDPVWTDHTFLGWYKEKECINAWDFVNDTVTNDVTLYAKWRVDRCIITAVSNNTNYGTVSGGGIYHGDGAVTVRAIPKAGCRFVRWTEGGLEVATNADYTFTPKTNRAFTAQFAKIGTPVISKISCPAYNNVKLDLGAVDGAAGYYVYRATSKYGTYKYITTAPGATTYTDTVPAWGKTYYYKVRAYCTTSSGITTCGSQSGYKYITPNWIKPTLTAERLNYHSIRLKWNDVRDADNYIVYRSTSSTGSYYSIATGVTKEAGATGLTYTVEMPAAMIGKTYYYKVRPVDDNGGSPVKGLYSNYAAAKASWTKLNLTAATHTYHSTRLNWNPVEDADYYYIWRSTYNGGYKQLLDSGTEPIKVSTTEYIDDNLPKGKTYYYKVQPIDEALLSTVGEGEMSGNKYAKADWPKLNLTAETKNYYSVALSWNAIALADKYEIERSTSYKSGYELIHTLTGVATGTVSYVDEDPELDINKTYYYRIKPYEGTVSGSYCGYKSAKLAWPALGLTAVSGGYDSVILNWNDIDAADTYQVYYNTSSGGTYTKTGRLTGVSNATVTELTAGTTYYFKIEATDNDKGVTYQYSGSKYARPLPAAPANLKVEKASATSMKITWDVVAGTPKYQVYRATSKYGTYTKITTTDLTSAASSGLTAGKTYYYKVRAYTNVVGSAPVYGLFTAPVGLKLV